LLASLKELKKEIEDFQLTIVGDGPEKNKLLSYVKKNGLKKNIIFSGVLNKYKIAKLMNKSDYLLSVSSVETFGITIAEAISCGLPCIIIDSGGPQDYINQENSYLVNNFSDINKILKKNIKNPKKFNKKKMHLYIKKRFCPNMIVKLYSKTFKKYSL
jgi:glycosyltransferase involved in cell wall biosynthesis